VGRNLLAYYRENPGKLVVRDKLSSFCFSMLVTGGAFGFFAALVIHAILGFQAAIQAGFGRELRLYPVTTNFVVTTFLCSMLLWGSNAALAETYRLELVRALLEDQGVVPAKSSGTIGVRILGIPAGIVMGGVIATLFMLFV
jgi:hypothetical protein